MLTPCIYRGDSVCLYREILFMWRVCARAGAGYFKKKKKCFRNLIISALKLLPRRDRRIPDELPEHRDVEYIVHAGEARRKSQPICHWTNALKYLKRFHKSETQLVPQSESLDSLVGDTFSRTSSPTWNSRWRRRWST